MLNNKKNSQQVQIFHYTNINKMRRTLKIQKFGSRKILLLNNELNNYKIKEVIYQSLCLYIN